MSILIKGMEMPSACADCDFCIETDDDHKCSRTKESLGLFAFELTRGMNCPLVPVPPHGRLIDADKYVEIIERLRDHAGNEDMAFALNWSAQSAAEMPTVIEAEEET